jgi:hypothetical protein
MKPNLNLQMGRSSGLAFYSGGQQVARPIVQATYIINSILRYSIYT